MVLFIASGVALVAELRTLPAVVIGANFESVIAAFGSISAFTISELERLPVLAALCTIPAVVNASIEMVPPEAIFILSKPLVLKDKVPPLADKPVVVLPVKVSDGVAVPPAGSCKVPVMVSPAFATLLLICVCTDDVVPDKNPNSVFVTTLERS